MFTISNNGKGIFKSKGSKFLSFTHHIKKIDQYKSLVAFYRMEYTDSCHVCSAYRLLINSRVDEHASDDGEPKGSAGHPILNELKRNDLVNSGTFVVRIFGGTLLGIPGLIDAYSNSALISIDNAKVVLWKELKRIQINYTYEYQTIIESLIKKYKVKVVNKNFSNEIHMDISIEAELLDQFNTDLKNASSGRIKSK